MYPSLPLSLALYAALLVAALCLMKGSLKEGPASLCSNRVWKLHQASIKQITGVPSSLFLLNAATPKYSWANCSRGKHEAGSSLTACATDLTSPPAQNATFPSAPACVLCKSTALAGRSAASAIPPGKCLNEFLWVEQICAPTTFSFLSLTHQAL